MSAEVIENKCRKMSLLGLVQKLMKTRQLKISSEYVDDNNEG
jgi:hypothetical protein